MKVSLTLQYLARELNHLQRYATHVQQQQNNILNKLISEIIYFVLFIIK